jgi:hypothetical protein
MQTRCYGALPLAVVAAQRQQLSSLWQFTSSRPLHSKVAVAESEVDMLADADKDLFDVYQVSIPHYLQTSIRLQQLQHAAQSAGDLSSTTWLTKCPEFGCCPAAT